MLKSLLRVSVILMGVALAAASGSSQPAQQQPPPYQGYPQPQGGYPPPQGGYPPPQGGYPQPQGGYTQPAPQPQGGYNQPTGAQPGFGNGGDNSGGDDDVVGWKVTMDDDSPLGQGFCGHAGRAGCQIAKAEAYTCVAQCQEGTIALLQEGREVTIGCSKITEDQCKQLASRILNTP